MRTRYMCRVLCRPGLCPSLGAPREARWRNYLRGSNRHPVQTRTWALCIPQCRVGVLNSPFPLSEHSVSLTVGNAETKHPCGFAGGCCACSQVPMISHSLRGHACLNVVRCCGSRAATGYVRLEHRLAVHRCDGCMRAAEARRTRFPLQRECRLQRGGGAVKSLRVSNSGPPASQISACGGFGGGGVCPVRVASAARQVDDLQ